MKIVIFGLTISSAWGNGHATLWRGLCRYLIMRGHRIVFLEKNAPYYSAHRDFERMPGLQLLFYNDFAEETRMGRAHTEDADVAIVTSYCPQGAEISDVVLASRAGLKIFYDLDTPVTLDTITRGEPVPYMPNGGLAGFDLVLSYTGGRALDELMKFGAKQAFPLYVSVDPLAHLPLKKGILRDRAALSYLGTYSEDRQDALRRLFIDASRKLPGGKFLLGGSLYPPDFPWTKNIFYLKHVAPPDHPAFYASSALTLNVTRGPMKAMGWCPSGRLFEAAACGAPILSDNWEGLGHFFEPGREILLAEDTKDAVEAILMGTRRLARIAQRAKERVLAQHTAKKRAAELESILYDAAASGKKPLEEARICSA